MLYASRSYLKAMVLAAGVGKRLDPITSHLPKPLVPIANRAVMEYTIRLLSSHGFSDIWANLYHLPALIKDYFDDGSQFNVKLNYVLEQKLSGDAGGVRTCKGAFEDGTFLVIMGDLFTTANLSYLLDQHKTKGALATIALKKVDDVSQFGVAVLDNDGWITEFQEKPGIGEARSNLISTGIYILEPAIFNFIPETGAYGFGKQLFPQLVNMKQQVLGVEIADYWSDVGTFDQYRQANFDALGGKVELISPGQYSESVDLRLWQGDNVKIDSGSMIQGQVLLGDNSVIRGGARISGNVILGEDCLIEDGAVVENSVIWSGSRISRQATVKNSILALNSFIESGQNVNDMAFAMPKKGKQTGKQQLLCH